MLFRVVSIVELSDSLKRFGTIDYAVFGAMLFCCSVVGLYFGYSDFMKRKRAARNQDTSDDGAAEYLMGGRNMKVFPISMSLVASFLSGISLLGTSTEIYLYGTQFMFIMIGTVLASLFMYFIIIPIFHELQVTSFNEYLQLRFSKGLRLYCSTMFSIATILWMPIVVYVPALAFNQTTGINIHIITLIGMAICIFYTMLGGIKAVVWTDVIQIVLMYGSMILIVVKGTMNVGGLGKVIERNMASGRIEAPEFSFDPTIRHSFWTLVVGGTFFYVAMTGLNQPMLQRYLALKDVKTARKSLIIFLIGVIVLFLLCSYNGLLLYATYHDCDPLTTKLATAKDQMMPLLVMKIFKDFPGLPGLFIAGIFSAALSSISTALNSMSAIILEDFFKPFVRNGISETMSSIIMRGTVLILGILSVSLVYVIQHMGSVLQLHMSTSTTSFGPMIGVYIIGIFFPRIGTKPTFLAAVCSFVTMSIIILKAQFEIARGNIKFETKPFYTDGCTYNFTQPDTIQTPILNDDDDVDVGKNIYHISYLYYVPLGSIILLVLAFLFSFIFGFQDSSEVDPKLLAPFIRRKYMKPKDSTFTCKDSDGKNTILYKFETEIRKC